MNPGQPRVIRYQDSTGCHPALCIPGRKHAHLVLISQSVTARKIALAQARQFPAETYRQQPYPVNRAVRQFRSAGRSLGISKTAKRLLTQANGKRK